MVVLSTVHKLSLLLSIELKGYFFADTLYILRFYIFFRPTNLVVVDFGCGNAKIARSVANKVYSFDLVAANDHVQVADMKNVNSFY